MTDSITNAQETQIFRKKHNYFSVHIRRRSSNYPDCFVFYTTAFAQFDTVVTGSKGALPVTLRRQPAAETCGHTMLVTVQQGSTASDPTATACSRDCGHRQQGSTASDPTATACSRDYGHRQQGSTASDPTATACSRDYGHRQHCQ